MELLLSVDGVISSRTVAIVGKLLDNVLSTCPVAIAFAVEAVCTGRIAGMRSRGESVLVGLHKVKLWAKRMFSVGIAVKPMVIFRVQLAINVLAGHFHSVEGVHASALELSNVNVPLNGAAEEVGRVEVRFLRVKDRVVHDEAAVVHIADVVLALRCAPVRDDVLGSVHTVDVDGNRRVVSTVHVLLLLEDEVLER